MVISVKKLLGMIVLSLLLSGNAYADVLKFSKCYTYQNDRDKTGRTSFDSSKYEKSEFTINFNTGTVLLLNILTDKEHKKQKSSWIKSGNAIKYGGSGSQSMTQGRFWPQHKQHFCSFPSLWPHC